MSYLLDTNACIAVLNDRASGVARKLATTFQQDVVLCHIVKGELLYGAYRSAKVESNLALLGSFFEQFSVLPFDDEATDAYGRIRAKLAASGKPIGPNDLIIAAIAVRHGATLVTHNTREFQRVGGLRLEDWEES
jgi:tRNA(fMet)-specific endonuclease VapC